MRGFCVNPLLLRAYKFMHRAMKKIFAFYSLAVLFAAISCSQTPQSAGAQKTGASIEFETTEHDFGTIPYKGDGTCEFIFKNTGKAPLLLTNVPEWPKEPINKGEQGKIKVSYNTRISGNFAKSISVYSNAAEEPVKLVIKGKVEAQPQEPAEVPEKE
jgi:hypothetical protein